VVLTGRKPEELAKVEKDVKSVSSDPSAKIISVTVYIAIESQVKDLYAKIQEDFGRHADVLINNAGAGGAGTISAIPWDDFMALISSHYIGAALMSKCFINSQPTPENPVGTIVYINSGLAGMIQPGMAGYSIAKLAGQRLIEYLDAEFPHLRAFSLAPGIIMTGLTNDFFKPYAKDHVELPGMWALYLSQERADFLRGGFVNINWDIAELEAHKAEIVEKKLLKIKWLPAEFGKGGHPFGA
jgi:NAD(P)-dependent dehydrogenase (short-subunit alcohol dehydrogenase family)